MIFAGNIYDFWSFMHITLMEPTTFIIPDMLFKQFRKIWLDQYQNNAKHTGRKLSFGPLHRCRGYFFHRIRISTPAIKVDPDEPGSTSIIKKLENLEPPLINR